MRQRKAGIGRKSRRFRVVPPRETFEELLPNLYEAVEGCLSVDLEPSEGGQIIEIDI
jgi:hypothetical protein